MNVALLCSVFPAAALPRGGFVALSVTLFNGVLEQKEGGWERAFGQPREVDGDKRGWGEGGKIYLRTYLIYHTHVTLALLCLFLLLPLY